MGDWLLAAGLLLLAAWIWRRFARTEEGVQAQIPALAGARLVYHDNGRTLRNHTYRVSARPDFVFRLADRRHVVVEYKSRRTRRVYDSDRQQARASALAAREAFSRVDAAFVLTGSGYYEEVEVPTDDEALYRLIEADADRARSAKQGRRPGRTADRYKCRGCGYMRRC